MKQRIVSQSMINYSVIHRGTGAEKVIKNVWFTFRHDMIIELFTSDTESQAFPVAEYDIIKRG